MAVINTNVKALFSQAALKSGERSTAIAMQQLSTGKRINSARDDAAGMAIATRMTHQIRSLNMAVRNAGDAISLIQTAEGATNEITDMMVRMRELAIQAVNDTNANEQRSYLDLEFQQLKQEIVRIADTTEWNGFPVLNGSAGERVGEMPLYKVTSQNLSGPVFINPTTLRTIGGTDAGEKQTLEISGSAPFLTGTIKVGGVDVVVDSTDAASTDALATKIQQTLSSSSSFNDTSGRSVTLSGSTLTITYTGADGDVDPIAVDASVITTASNDLAFSSTETRQAITLSKENFKDSGTFIKSGTLSMNMDSTGAVTAAFSTQTGETVNMTGSYHSTAVTETAAVTFNAMVANQTISMGGLTYTANSDGATADEVASDFLSLSNGYAGGTKSHGTFTGQLNGFSTASSITADTTATVLFTSASTGANVTDLVANGSGDLPAITITNGAPAGSISFYNSLGKNDFYILINTENENLKYSVYAVAEASSIHTPVKYCCFVFIGKIINPAPYTKDEVEIFEKLNNLKTGLTIPNITKQILEELEIPIPTIEKQKELVEYLEFNDNLIKTLEQEIEINKNKAELLFKQIIYSP